MPARTGLDTDKLVAIDRATIVHPHLGAGHQDRIVMVDGEGCRVRDSTGRTYLDGTSGGLWLMQVGHGRRELAEAAARQYDRLEFFCSFWEYTNDRAIELADRLVGLAPAQLDHVYFASGGSEGMETAIKMARYAHARRGEGRRTWILSRHSGYHGLGFGSGTATGFDVYHDGFGPMLPHVRHLTPAWPYRQELYGGEDPTDFLVCELEAVIAELGADNIAAFVGEPVMGVAGVLVPPDDYWPRMAALLRQHGITLILDEVVTGYGRTGEWFGAQRFDVQPDIIVSAKGITSGYAPLGAVLFTSEIAEAITGEAGFPVGFTYNGHPVSCAVALANLDVIEREDLVGRAREMGGYLLGRLGELADLPVVGEVRGVGMMFALELVADKTSRAPLTTDGAIAATIRDEAGVITRENAHNLVLSPPLVLAREEADEAVAAVASVLGRVDVDGSIRGRG